MTNKQDSRTWPAHARALLWAVIPGIAAFIFVYGYTGDSEAGNGPASVRYADPAAFQPGVLDDTAVRTAQAFDEFPLLWLGPAFEGLHLTAAYRSQQEDPGVKDAGGTTVHQDSMVLFYGACTPSGSPGDHASCVPPLQIIVDAGNMVPPPDSIAIAEEAGVSAPFRTRGVTARHISTGTTLWFENGLTVTIHGEFPMRVRAVAQLRSVNTAVFGALEVRVGDNLDALGRIPFREK